MSWMRPCGHTMGATGAGRIASIITAASLAVALVYALCASSFTGTVKGSSLSELLVSQDVNHSTYIDNSVFCWAVTLPFGNEPLLLETQWKKKTGIFSCDEYAIYSNQSNVIPNVENLVVEQDMTVQFGGENLVGAVRSAFNRRVIFKVWQQMMADGRWRDHLWTVKADPDTVIIMPVLKDLLAEYQSTAVAAPNGMFFTNCRFRLHGPIEVLSRRAVHTLLQGFERVRHTHLDPREDVAIYQALTKLHVQNVSQNRLLAEKNCMPREWYLCPPGYASYHPMKSSSNYSKCTTSASGPHKPFVADPRLPLQFSTPAPHGPEKVHLEKVWRSENEPWVQENAMRTGGW